MSEALTTVPEPSRFSNLIRRRSRNLGLLIAIGGWVVFVSTKN